MNDSGFEDHNSWQQGGANEAFEEQQAPAAGEVAANSEYPEHSKYPKYPFLAKPTTSGQTGPKIGPKKCMGIQMKILRPEKHLKTKF